MGLNILHRGLARSTLAVFLLPLSCKPDAPRQSPSVASPQQPLENAEGRVLDCSPEQDGAAPSHAPVWYAVDSMTRKLHRYPSFAEYAGLEEVSSCEEALAYVQAYDAYAEAHPDFESLPDPKAPTAERKQFILPRLKIRNGTRVEGFSMPDRLSPIVHLEPAHWRPNGSSEDLTYFCGLADEHKCTGVLIAKNWILTAAHCLQPADLMEVPGVRGPGRGSLSCPDGGLDFAPGASVANQGVASWIVRWAGTSAVDKDHLYTPAVAFEAYQIPDPSYNPLNDLGDFALLHMSPARDGDLPADVSKGAAAWLTATEYPSTAPAWELSIAGFGAWIDTGGNQKAENPLTNARQAPILGWKSYTVELVLGTGDQSNAPCHGDSGGPLYRGFPSDSSRMTIYAIASVFYNLTGPKGKKCPSTGDVFVWQRADSDDFRTWIDDSMRRFNDGPCRPVEVSDPIDTMSTMKLLECWGLPCKEDAHCPANHRCVNSGSKMSQLGLGCSDICTDGTCGCVIGRCQAP